MSISPIFLALVLWLVCLTCHSLLFRRIAESDRSFQLQAALRFPALCLAFLFPLWWWSLSEAFPSQLHGGLAAAVFFFVGAGLVRVVEIRKGSPTRLRLFRGVAYSALTLASVGVALSSTREPGHIILPMLCTAVVYWALNLIRLAVGRSGSSGGVAWRAVQQQLQPWLFPLFLLMTVFYLLSQWDVIGWDERPTLHVQVLLGAIGLAALGDILIQLIYRWRVYRWVEGAWYRDLLRGVLFIAVGWNYLTWVSGHNLGDLLVGSAFLSVGLGFALKPTLGNLAAGLALRLAKPYVIGDWVHVDSQFGKICSIDWRSTALETLTGDLVVVPNHGMARSVITNHSSPTPIHGCWGYVKMGRGVAPGQVRQVLQSALASHARVLALPSPQVFLWRLGCDGLEYRFIYWIETVCEQPQSESEVAAHVSYCLRRAELTPLTPVLRVLPPAGDDVGPPPFLPRSTPP